MKKRNEKRKAFSKKLKAAALISALLFLLYIADKNVRPLVYRYCENEMRLLSVNIINNVVLRQTEENSDEYKQLIDITYLQDGTVSGINLNVQKLNTLKEKLLLEVNDELNKLGENKIKVPLGTIINSVWFNGAGPRIGICFAPVSYAAGEIKTGFQSAGYNQSLYTVSMVITVEMQAVIPGYINSSIIKSEVALAQTVIVGNVPQFNYTA